MAYFRSDTLLTVPKFLKSQGFLATSSDPTEEDAEEFIDVMILTGRSDLKFTPIVNTVYEKKLSAVTSLIVEGYKEKNRMYYDFYKAKYYRKDGQPTDVKVYGSHLLANELLVKLERFFAYFNDNSES